jgi:hypothetical protein
VIDHVVWTTIHCVSLGCTARFPYRFAADTSRDEREVSIRRHAARMGWAELAFEGTPYLRDLCPEHAPGGAHADPA